LWKETFYSQTFDFRNGLNFCDTMSVFCSSKPVQLAAASAGVLDIPPARVETSQPESRSGNSPSGALLFGAVLLPFFRLVIG
jgi:hypothetical protein